MIYFRNEVEFRDSNVRGRCNKERCNKDRLKDIFVLDY